LKSLGDAKVERKAQNVGMSNIWHATHWNHWAPKVTKFNF
jgi:hypothetical protein